MVERIKGVTVKTVIEGRGVDVVFKSPYHWRIYEGAQEVTKDFGFNGRRVDDTDPRWSAFHAAVSAGEISTRLHV